MSQYDETTEKNAEERFPRETTTRCDGKVSILGDNERRREGFTAGRNSAKESLEILARALEHIEGLCSLSKTGTSIPRAAACDAIAAVKARGDYPFEE